MSKMMTFLEAIVHSLEECNTFLYTVMCSAMMLAVLHSTRQLILTITSSTGHSCERNLRSIVRLELIEAYTQVDKGDLECCDSKHSEEKIKTKVTGESSDSISGGSIVGRNSATTQLCGDVKKKLNVLTSDSNRPQVEPVFNIFTPLKMETGTNAHWSGSEPRRDDPRPDQDGISDQKNQCPDATAVVSVPSTATDGNSNRTDTASLNSTVRVGVQLHSSSENQYNPQKFGNLSVPENKCTTCPYKNSNISKLTNLDTSGIPTSGNDKTSTRYRHSRANHSASDVTNKNGQQNGSDRRIRASSEDDGDVFVQRNEDKLIERMKKEIDRLTARNKSLQERLSKQVCDQLGSDVFENLSLGDNRPTMLICRYENLYTEARQEAMDALDDLMEDTGDQFKADLLMSILLESFQVSTDMIQEIKDKLAELLQVSSRDLDSLTDIYEAVLKFCRTHIAERNLSRPIQTLCEQLVPLLHPEVINDHPIKDPQEFSPHKQYIDSLHPSLRHFVKECVTLAWALTVQRPSYVVNPGHSKSYTFPERDPRIQVAVTKGSKCCDKEKELKARVDFNTDKHQRFHSSDPESTVICRIVWPALVEENTGFYVYKAVVIT